MGIRIGPTFYFVILLLCQWNLGVASWTGLLPSWWSPESRAAWVTSRGRGLSDPSCPVAVLGAQGGPWGSAVPAVGRGCPFLWVPDSDLTEGDTNTMQGRGAGDGGEVKAEKLRESSEVEAERINTCRLRARFPAHFSQRTPPPNPGRNAAT